MILTETLQDTLNLIATVCLKKIEVTDLMLEWYEDGLKDIPVDIFNQAAKYFYNLKQFPTVKDFQEFGITPDADWHTIMAVASGTTKSATISGISAIALTTATATSSILAALKKISFCDDPFQLREIRKDWNKLTSIPRIESALPPADVEITLVVKTASNDFEYPADDDFSIRTASMIRCIRDKGSVSPAWMPIIERFPAAKKREVLDAVEANNWVTPALKESKLYRKYQSTAEAMREIDEAAINETIASVRNLSKTFDK